MLTSWGDPDSPVNGRKSVSGYTEGDTVTYTCNAGYIQAQCYLLYIFSNYSDSAFTIVVGNAHARLPMSIILFAYKLHVNLIRQHGSAVYVGMVVVVCIP